ncbi:DUF3343 domain-containing protein [Clostridium sp. Cult3]|uniref:DUF3343 domain-containing protein n=1 Tax=Clostridium sp. Cult3 TaxID=2079004 RepID=UPI001F3DE5E9|nr:DUF3343 domain-containing protein [Clostridium sp. Cult3]MCF6459963.1 hypothetical protein [Clostridium sp. Cult3]
MEDTYCVVTFHVTQHALLFEKTMKEIEYPVKLMPVPRQVSSSCGTAAKIPCDKKKEILALCKEKNLPIEGFYKIEHKKKKSWF